MVMKDIIESPSQWAVRAAGTPIRLIVAIIMHVLLVIGGFWLDSLALFVVSGVILPGLYLYAMYRIIPIATERS